MPKKDLKWVRVGEFDLLHSEWHLFWYLIFAQEIQFHNSFRHVQRHRKGFGGNDARIESARLVSFTTAKTIRKCDTGWLRHRVLPSTGFICTSRTFYLKKSAHSRPQSSGSEGKNWPWRLFRKSKRVVVRTTGATYFQSSDIFILLRRRHCPCRCRTTAVLNGVLWETRHGKNASQNRSVPDRQA